MTLPASPWLVTAVRRRAPRLRLFCFPYAGGGASAFREWPALLPDDIEVTAVQLPGRESRFGEAPARELAPLVEHLAEALAPRLDLPYAIFGHSLGTLLGYETVLSLLRRAAPVPLLAVMSGRGAPHASRGRGDLHRKPDAEFIDALRDMQGTPEEVLRDAEMMRLLLPSLRADFALAADYRIDLPQRLPCALAVYGGLADVDVPRTHLQAWQDCTAQPIRLRMFPGGHFFLHGARFALLQALARDLYGLLEDPPRHRAEG